MEMHGFRKIDGERGKMEGNGAKLTRRGLAAVSRHRAVDRFSQIKHFLCFPRETLCRANIRNVD